LRTSHSFSPREQGAIAYIQGKSLNDNPFSPMQVEYDDWSDGFAMEFAFVSDIFDESFGVPIGNA